MIIGWSILGLIIGFLAGWICTQGTIPLIIVGACFILFGIALPEGGEGSTLGMVELFFTISIAIGLIIGVIKGSRS